MLQLVRKSPAAAGLFFVLSPSLFLVIPSEVRSEAECCARDDMLELASPPEPH
jgi:hypothetical protein